MPGVLVVQQLTTTWSKRSRGGDGARRRRNAVPLAVAVPADCSVGAVDGWRHHVVAFGEANGFTAVGRPCRRGGPDTPVRAGCVLVTLGGVGAEVAVDFQHLDGVPSRTRLDRTGTLSPVRLAPLAPGQWCRIRYNARHADRDTGHWWYELIVVNVGLFRPSAGYSFTRTPPAYLLDELARLR